MKEKYKAVIIGAGPSGLATAINLKNIGTDDILVIDKAEFPRYKCCAGYITAKTAKEYLKLGLDIKDCNYMLIKDFCIYYRLKKYQTIVNKFLYTNRYIDRTELDFGFFKTAERQGIKIAQSSFIKELDRGNKLLLLNTGVTVAYDFLIFADGASSSGGKYNPLKKRNIALQAIFKADVPDGIDIHFGVTKRGYAWVSRHSGLVNIGITDIYNPKLNYNQVLKSFIAKLGLECDDSNITGSFTPIGLAKPFIDGGIYYVGDAAGACDPFTLSGLRYGLKSGQSCAKAISYSDSGIYKKFTFSLKLRFFVMRLMQTVFYNPFVQFLFFNVGCRILKPLISFAFNNFFVGEK